MTATHRLTARHVELAAAGKHTDGGGLSLVVKPSGRRSWVARLSVDGKRRDIGLGSYPTVSLDSARQRVAELQAKLAAANETADARARRLRPEAVPTFAEAAAEVYALNAPRWRGERHAHDWLSSLRRHAAPLMDLPVDRIARADVLAVLHPIWHDKPPTARRVRQRIRKVLDYAMALYEHIPSNAAGPGIDAALPPMPRTRSHQRALGYHEVLDALERIAASGSCDAARLCLRFLVLTAARSGEARGARWSEMDTANAEWRIPAERMKSGVAHRVPLSPQALDVVEAARQLGDGSALVFPSPQKPGQPLTWQTLLRMLRVADLDCTAHGFRSSFKTWSVEANSAPWAVSEAALAHTLGNTTEAAYVRGDLFELRRVLMVDWAEFAAPQTGSGRA